jgi:hypothetical protein
MMYDRCSRLSPALQRASEHMFCVSYYTCFCLSIVLLHWSGILGLASEASPFQALLGLSRYEMIERFILMHSLQAHMADVMFLCVIIVERPYQRCGGRRELLD